MQPLSLPSAAVFSILGRRSRFVNAVPPHGFPSSGEGKFLPAALRSKKGGNGPADFHFYLKVSIFGSRGDQVCTAGISPSLSSAMRFAGSPMLSVESTATGAWQPGEIRPTVKASVLLAGRIGIVPSFMSWGSRMAVRKRP